MGGDAADRWPLGVTKVESLRRWVRAENAELKRVNAILKAASSFFAAELDRPRG